MWPRLAEHAHLVAVDLPGFGHSERRDSLLAPRAMGKFVIRLADEFGLENPHTVGPPEEYAQIVSNWWAEAMPRPRP
jgi:pimeloyl-ACP methyl ester carboxylesterase